MRNVNNYIAATIIIFVIGGYLLGPHTWGHNLRNLLAAQAVSAEFPSLAVIVLKPLAAAGDPLAQNNLGVLIYRGIGITDDHPTARRLFEAAARNGFARAKLNLLLMFKHDDLPKRLHELEYLAKTGEPRAAAYAFDIYNSGAKRIERDQYPRGSRYDPLFALSKIALQDNFAEENLLFGWGLLNLARFMDEGGSNHRTALHLVAKNFYAASKAREGSGNAGLATLVEKFADHLPDNKLRKLILAKSAEQWLEAAVKVNHLESMCKIAVIRSTRLLDSGNSISKDQIDELLPLFAKCLFPSSPDGIHIRQRTQDMKHWHRVRGNTRRSTAWMIRYPRQADYPGDRSRAQYEAGELAKRLQNLRRRHN